MSRKTSTRERAAYVPTQSLRANGRVWLLTRRLALVVGALACIATLSQARAAEPADSVHGIAATSEPSAAAPQPSATEAGSTLADATEESPLGTPAVRRRATNPPATGSSPSWFTSTTGRTIAALAVVIVLAFVARLVVNRLVSRAGGLAGQFGPGGRAPSGVLEVLGRYPVSRGHTLVLLRMDRRVLLLGQSAAGFTTLAQATDPDEVASLLIKTRDDEDASISSRFTSILRQVETDPAVLTDDADSRVAEEPWAADDLSGEPAAPANGAIADLRRRLFGNGGITA